MRKGLLVLALTLLSASFVFAYPTSLNIIPTADTLPSQAYVIYVEGDVGAPTTADLRTQFGFSEDWEVGLDVVRVPTGTAVQVNTKWRLIDERERTPNVSVGVFNVNVANTATMQPYLAVSQDAGDLRWHAGLLINGLRGMLGVEYRASDETSIIADWTMGAGNYATLGVAHEFSDRYCLQAYYALNNTAGGGNYIGVRLAGTWEDW